MLWDMTADKDVACCLIKHDILPLTKCLVEESIAPRLTVKIDKQLSVITMNYIIKTSYLGNCNWNTSKSFMP